MSSKTKKLRIATRGSKLALWQAEYVASLLKAQGYDSELNIIKTTGDRVQDRFLHEIGGKGLFVRELESSMAAGETDIAVHSLKDLPARIPEGFCLGAILKRHCPQDAIIFRSGRLEKLVQREGQLGQYDFVKMGPITIASSSLRRQSLFRGVSQDIKLVAVRGNVDTRLAKLEAGDWDALILAAASLERLGLNDLPSRLIDPSWFVPCAAQGALAIECTADSPFREVLSKLADHETTQAANLERLILERLGGDCTMPFGAFVRPGGKGTLVSALVLNYKGQEARFDLDLSQKIAKLEIASVADEVLRGLSRRGLDSILKDLSIDPPDLGPLN